MLIDTRNLATNLKATLAVTLILMAWAIGSAGSMVDALDQDTAEKLARPQRVIRANLEHLSRSYGAVLVHCARGGSWGNGDLIVDCMPIRIGDGSRTKADPILTIYQ